MQLVKILVSAEHNFFGHHGLDPGVAPIVERSSAELEPGRGIVGDRFHARPPGHRGQVTFFAEETWLRLCEALEVRGKGPEVFRRNLLVRDADLNALIGQPFTLQGIAFEGAEYCKPCYWMDRAFAEGTLALLTAWKAGGLRARILTPGRLTTERVCAAAR